MNIACFGINHKKVKLDIRARFALEKSQIPNFLGNLSRVFDEALVLSTCNRIEVYIADTKDDLKTRLFDYMRGFLKIERGIFDKFYFYKNKDAVYHLFFVASSLNSMVVGETQILGQVKEAYKIALENRTTKKTLNRLFQHSFMVAKRVRTETGISRGNYSISSIACRLAEEKLGILQDKTGLIIGAGKTGEITLKHIKEKGMKNIFVASRSFDRAKGLSEKFGFFPCYNFREKIKECHLIISQTSSPHYIIKKRDIPLIRKRPLILIDLAVPPDIEKKTGEIEDVFLYNIDYIQEIAEKNMTEKGEEVLKAKGIIDEEVAKYHTLE